MTSWQLADLGEFKGRQALFILQSPQRLKNLREHSIIESAVSSNRIEGVEIDKARVGTIIFGKPLLRDRNEEEIAGYREALNLIHDKKSALPVSEEIILKLHRIAKGRAGDAGAYKKKDGDIVEKYPDGTTRIRFRTVPAADTPAAIRDLTETWDDYICNRHVHPLISLAAFNLDFLCIHPFRDGNGRVSRLLFLLQCYHLGYEVGRYISLERLIEKNKKRYYQTLEESSLGWHEKKHNPWPFVNYMLFILNSAYREFEERLGRLKSPRGEKTEAVIRAIDEEAGAFHISDVQRKCPGVSIDLIRKILKSMRDQEQVECLGRGQKAKWRKTDNTH